MKKKYYSFELDENGMFCLTEKLLDRAWLNCFETKEEATQHFKEAESIATDRFLDIMSDIEVLKNRCGGFEFSCLVQTLDDTGLSVEPTLEFNVNGYDFIFKIGN